MNFLFHWIAILSFAPILIGLLYLLLAITIQRMIKNLSHHQRTIASLSWLSFVCFALSYLGTLSAFIPSAMGYLPIIIHICMATFIAYWILWVLTFCYWLPKSLHSSKLPTKSIRWVSIGIAVLQAIPMIQLPLMTRLPISILVSTIESTIIVLLLVIAYAYLAVRMIKIRHE